MLGGARAALQPACDLQQEFVARGVAELVVDLLEAVEVEQEHREFLAGQGHPPQRGFERLVEGEAVGQQREGILPDRALGLDLPDHASRERE
ncbi:hypothetical protein ACVWXQ_008022 [Bradyrhizobium sp. S3.14.4]